MSLSLASRFVPRGERFVGLVEIAPFMPIVIRATLEDASGFGEHVEQTARQLERLGHAVRFDPLNDGVPIPDRYQNRLFGLGESGPVIQISPPFLPCPPGAVYATTWESDTFPTACATHLANARLVVVNSDFIRRAVEGAGVAPRVCVIPLGIDPAVFRPTLPRPKRCRFGVVANLTHSARRKNVAAAVAAFRLAFPMGADAELVLKVDNPTSLGLIDDSRIRVVAGRLSTTDLVGFLNRLTCLASASMAEGFGLVPLQALACGRPVIATPFGGHAEYLDVTVGYPVDYRLVQPDWYEGGGTLAEPSVESIAAAMRAVFDDPTTAAAKGARGVERATAFTWDRYGERLLAAMG